VGGGAVVGGVVGSVVAIEPLPVFRPDVVTVVPGNVVKVWFVAEEAVGVFFFVAATIEPTTMRRTKTAAVQNHHFLYTGLPPVDPPAAVVAAAVSGGGEGMA
jgi:hypothetical protein